jgi:enoyl-[acyl-carrier-protein] reductase (NADH)
VREAALPHAREVNEPPGYRPQRHRDARETRKQEAVFARHATDWGGPGLLLQAIAFAPHADVHRRMVDCGSAGYPSAIDVAVRSFLRLAQPAEPLTQAGDCLFSATLHRRKHDSSRFRSARDGMSPPR